MIEKDFFNSESQLGSWGNDSDTVQNSANLELRLSRGKKNEEKSYKSRGRWLRKQKALERRMNCSPCNI